MNNFYFPRHKIVRYLRRLEKNVIQELFLIQISIICKDGSLDYAFLWLYGLSGR